MDEYEQEPDEGAIAVIDKPRVETVTPAQAKINAVSSLLAKAVEKASELRLTPEETIALKAEFPDDAFRPGAAGKENLIYIEHVHLRNRLDDVLGMGQAVLVPRSLWSEEFEYHKDGQKRTGTKVYVQAMLMIRGCYITEAVGEMTYYPGNQGADYSDAVEGAETAALRRCCKKFGVGLQAWSKTWCEGWWMRKGTQQPRPTTTYGTQGDDNPTNGHTQSNLPPCPKCGKTDSVIVGKPEHGGGLVCWKKRNNGCGHKFDGKDVRTGQDAEPTTDYKPILADWLHRLNPETVNLAKLNEMLPEFKAIPGKHPQRAKVWAEILKFSEEFNCHFNHGTKTFQEGES